MVCLSSGAFVIVLHWLFQICSRCGYCQSFYVFEYYDLFNCLKVFWSFSSKDRIVINQFNFWSLMNVNNVCTFSEPLFPLVSLSVVLTSSDKLSTKL